MLQKHNKKRFREWGRHWNNDDGIPGKMNRLEHGRKELEEETSRFVAARPTETEKDNGDGSRMGKKIATSPQGTSFAGEAQKKPRISTKWKAIFEK